MNSLYMQLFNQQYNNLSNQHQLQLQRQHDFEQRHEIAKAVKAVKDYLDAARKVEPAYQQLLLDECFSVLIEETQRKR